MCAGIAGIQCFQDGFVCISDGGCDPQTTSDCAGVCSATCDNGSCPQGMVCVSDGSKFECVVSLVCQGIICGDGDVCVLNEGNNPECVPISPTTIPTSLAATSESAPTASVTGLGAPNSTSGASSISVVALPMVVSIPISVVAMIICFM